jgi:hypothetical protein
MRKSDLLRARTAAAATGIVSLLFASPAMAASGVTSPATEPQVRAVVSIAGMNFAPTGSVAKSALLSGDSGTAGETTKTFTGTSAEVDAAIAEWKSNAITSTSTAPGKIQPMASATVFGDCGWSSIEVRDPILGTPTGYLKAEFQLNKPGTTYSTDTLLFSSSAWDLWTLHVPRSGNLNGGTYWSTSGLFDVPSAQNYGGTLIHATAAVSGGNCNTSGPHVDNVYIQ